MALSHGRVVKVGETLYPHEQEGIAFAIAALPDTDPYHLWALVDLMDPSTGRLLEIDLLVLVLGEVLSVLAKRGEPSTPADPARGEVWSSIAAHWRDRGFDSDYMTVANTDRNKLASHPWSLGGGGTIELKDLLEERAFQRLGQISTIGVFGMTNADECMLMTRDQSLLRESSVPWSRQALSSALATRTDAQRVAALASLGDPTEAVGIALDSGDVVPRLAAQRFTATGLAKWHEWLQVWQAQRLEDAGGPPPSTIPPKYVDKDFQDQRYWRLRGKLEVPKEHFISYPGCESDEDGEPVYGWAGWNHLQRAQALASLYQKRKIDEGWTTERLTPMLAGLLELLPWIKQWHNEPDAELDGQKMGDYFEQFLEGECQAKGFTHVGLEAWSPTRATKKSAKTAPIQETPEAAEPERPKQIRKKGKE